MFNDLTYICEIYIQRVCEGIEKKPKKVLSIQDGDGPNPSYFIKGFRPSLFRSPFKIHAKAYLFIIERERTKSHFKNYRIKIFFPITRGKIFIYKSNSIRIDT